MDKLTTCVEWQRVLWMGGVEGNAGQRNYAVEQGESVSRYQARPHPPLFNVTSAHSSCPNSGEVRDMEFDIEKLEAVIIQKVSDELYDSINLRDAIEAKVKAKVDDYLARGAGQVLDGVITKAINDGFDHEYRQVDSFGRPAGQATTIRQQLERRVQGYWAERVDKNGKMTDSSYSSISRAEYIMLTVTADGFSADMKQHMATVAGSLKDSLREKLRETLDGLLTEIFHVRSLGDQNKSDGEKNAKSDGASNYPAAPR